LLQAFEDCPAWEHKNQRTQEKVETFTRGELMRQVNHNVSRRLGFNYDLPFCQYTPYLTVTPLSYLKLFILHPGLNI